MTGSTGVAGIAVGEMTGAGRIPGDGVMHPAVAIAATITTMVTIAIGLISGIMRDPSVYLPPVRDRTLWSCGDLVLMDRLYFVQSSKKPEKNRGVRNFKV